MKSSRKISGLVAVLLAVLLFATPASSVESTQAEFKNASWQLIDSDSTPGSILVGTNTDTQNPAGSLPNVSSRWSSRIMDSQRNDTRWLDIDWNGSEPAGTNVQARALTADGFVDWGPINSVSNTQLTSWKRTFTESYDYADFRTNYLGFTNVSFRGLGHDASDQNPSVWYSFEGITSNVKDFTGNGNTGSLDSAERQEGYTGKAAYFDGSSRFSASSTGTSLTNPDGTIWMEMWVNPTNLDSSSQTLIDKQEEFRLNLENNGEVWFRTYGNTSRESGALTQNEWSHVAVKWDAGNSVTVYVDGTETTYREISDTSPNTGNTVYFGQTYQGDQSFTGYIDEFRAFRNQSNVELLTDVTDFTSPVQEAGETTSDIERQYVQAMIRPESTDSYTIDNIRVGSNTSYSSWSDSGERLDAPQRRYGLIQLNLSGTDTDSPQVDEVRLDTSIPDNTTAPEQPKDATPGGEVDVLWDQPLAIEIGINDSNISTTNDIQVDYRMTNLNLFCSFNTNTGLCEQVNQNTVTTTGNRLVTNNYPIYTDLGRVLDGGESKIGSFQFTVPPSDFSDWNLQVNQRYNFQGEYGEAVSNTIVDYTGPSRAGQGESCTYATDCQKGLYCGDTNGDATPDTCIEQDSSYSGNICAEIGSGYKERISTGGSCELSNPGSENSNNPSGVQCSTSSDCTTNYCYDGNGDGTKTCQTSPTSGSSSGTLSGVNATQPSSCYFAGQTYSEGTSPDIFSDGVTNTCSNGKWEHDVKAVMDYSDVKEDSTIQIDYNVYNFKDGYDYSGGFIQRNTGNQIDLGEIRFDVSGETYTRSISGTVDGGRNLSGTVTVDVPELNHSDALTTRTLLDYNYGGTHQTVVGTPLKGELDSEDYTSGECRRGYQVADTQYCVYSSQESPSSGETVSSSPNPGNLCEIRASSNAERRVTNSGACEVASYGAENNNLPENYQCSTKEDCISNYCYDDGTGYKTCETNPLTGTSAGVTSSPQSCGDNTCFYGGNCYQEGTEVEGFQVSGATSANQTMTCQSGKWNYEGELPISIEVPTDNLEQGTTGINLVTHNPYEYCSYSEGDCNEITENFIELKSVTFSISDHPPQKIDLSSTLKGEDDYNNSINVDVPDLSHTASTRVRAVLIYEYQGELRQVSTNNVFRGQTWRNRTSGACDNGFSTAAGYFCEFDGENQTVSGTGTITDSSSDAGGLCKSQGAGTLERVSTSGACKLASPGADNNNLPAGKECREQSDCVTDYCYDEDQDGMKTCQTDISTGANGGLEISDETDCGENACAVVGQCYANGTSFDYYDQTLTCDEGELQANASASPLLDLDSLASFETLKQQVAYTISPNSTIFDENAAIKFSFSVWNQRPYCDEDQTTGLCTRVDSNLVQTDLIRSWFDLRIDRFDRNINLYGGEKKEGSFVAKVPDNQEHHDFRTELQFDIPSTGETRYSSATPVFEPLFNRGSAGTSCRYSTDCQSGLYCGDTGGDAVPDTCLATSENAGNVCAQEGSMSERIDIGGSCDLAEPGFENKNLKEGMSCRTAEDCVTDYCYDSSGDGTLTCETDRTEGSQAGVKATADSTGLNSCFFGGRVYSEGSSVDINADSDTETCENGVWQEEMKVDTSLSYGFSDNGQAELDYKVHNPRRACDRSSGFCQPQDQRSIDINKFVINIAGQQIEKSVSETVLPERNVSGTLQLNIPEIYHTQIYNTRVFAHLDDGGTTEIIATNPAVRGDTLDNRTSGSCTSGYQVMPGYFCEFSSEENPSQAGDIVAQGSGFNPGNICAISEPTSSEHRVTTSGMCQPAESGMENRNLPQGYQCTTEQDCATDYCYDKGSGDLRCQTEPQNGTYTGVLSARQSGSATTCHFGGQVYPQGTSIDVFGQSATCNQSQWDYDSEVGFKAEIPDTVEPGQNIQIDYSAFNALQYCKFDNRSNTCLVIEENTIGLESMVIEFRSQKKTINLDDTLAGGQRHDDSVTFQVPDFDYTENIPITMKVTANRTYADDSTTHFIEKTTDVVRGSDWRRETSGSCRNGYSTESGYYCAYNNQTNVEYGAGTVKSNSASAGELCETPQATTTTERVSSSGQCKPAQAGARNQNQPDGYLCQNQADCINDYCYDQDMDGEKTCHTNPSDGSQAGEKISEKSDCNQSSCNVAGYCYADGSSFQYNDQTFFCDTGEVTEEPPETAPTGIGDVASEILSRYQQIAYTISPNSTVFDENAAIEFSFQVWNQRPYCEEDQTTGLCTRVDSNLVQTDLIRSWFDQQISNTDRDIDLYGGEKKQGSFVKKVPDSQEHHDFRSVLQYNISAGETRYSSATPVFEPLFDRGSAGFTCRYSTDCEDGLYCGDTDGDAVPDTCKATSDDTGNVCAQEGSMSERIDIGGSCDLAEPGFENKNLKEGMQCRTAEDCITDYCFDSSGDGTMTCETDRTNGSQAGVKATADSTGLNSCFFGGRVYSEGSSVDINADSDTETCQNGVWQEEMQFDTSLEYGFTDADQVQLDYKVHNPRRACDRSSGFCNFQGQRSVDIDKIVVNVAGQQIEKNIGETVQPERNVSGTLQLEMPEIYHTQIYNTRVFAHLDDGGTTEIIATTPAVRGNTMDNRTSGSCMSGYQVMPGYFCEFDSEENPSQAGDIVAQGSGFNPGNICAISEPTSSEHRVTTSGTCQPAESSMENRNLPQGYQCTTEQDCATDYCYDRGTGDLRCQTEPQNGSTSGVLSARQSGSATTCHFGGDVYSNGTTIDIFGQSATCNQSQWDYDSEIGFKAEIPDTVEPGENLEINYSAANALRYCTYQDTGDNCTVIDDNKITLQDMNIEFRSDDATVNLDDTLAGGQRHDDSVTFQVPDFDYTQNIPITVRVNAQRTLDNGSTFNFYEKTTDLVRGSDWRRETSGSCRNGYSTESGYYCSYNNETTVEYGSGNVRVSSNGAGELCETPQATTTTERISTDGSCKLAQAGAQNSNQPDGNACQNQADCVSDYCYDENQDGQKTCQPTVSTGSESGLKISADSDCPAAACEVRGYCYENGASLEYNGQTQYCDNGEIRNEPPTGTPETPGELAEEVLTEYRDFTFEVFDTVVNSGTVDVGFRFTNLENFAVELHQNYITSGIGVENQTDLSTTIPAGESEEFYLNSSQRPIDGVKLFYSEVRVTNSTGEINQWVTSDQTCYIGGLNSFEGNCIRDDPEIREVSFNDYPNSHKFNITARGFDPDGSSDVQSCTFEAEHEDGGVREFTGNIDYSYGEDSEFLCGYDSIGSSIDGYEPTDHLRIVTEVEDSTGKTGTEIEGHQIPNRPPTQDVPVLNPEPALSGDDITGYTNNLVDPEGDQISLDYNWTVNDEPTGWDTQTLGSGNYTTFDWITLYITPSDPYEKGQTVSKEMQIREAIVDIREINFENYSESHEFNTSAIVNATDPTGIETCEITASQNSNSYTFDGTVNSSFGAPDQISCNYSSIDSSHEGLEPLGETEVEFFIEDENNANDTASEFNPIPNTPPSVTAPTFSPDPARTSEDLTGINGTPSDPEGDEVTYSNRWYVNDVDIGFTGTTLPSDEYETGDTVRFETTPYDGYEYGEKNSSSIEITDVSFSVSNLTFTDYSDSHEFNISADVFAENISDVNQCQIIADDLDGNSYSYTGSLDNSYGSDEEALCSYSSISDSESGFNATELIDITVEASTDSSTESATGQNRLPNRPPETNEPFISPKPATESDDLTGSLGSTTDVEGDTIDVDYEWYVNGNNVSEGTMGVSEEVTLQSGNFSGGDNVSFNVTPSDPYESGAMNSTQIQISTGGLSITEIRFDDYATRHAYDTEVEIQSEDTSSLQSCSLEFSDGDGNSFSATGNIDTGYGSSNQALCTYSDTSSSTSGFEVNEQIDVNATVSDDTTSVSDSATHAIPNQAPSFEQVLTNPLAPVNENNVTVNATINDPEGDGVEWANFTVTHENGTELITNQNGSITGGEWISPEFSVDENINYSWTVESYDSFNKSNKTGWFTTTNEAPDITSISTQNVTGDHAYDIEYVVNDPDGDFDINTCSISASDGDGNSFSASANIDAGHGSSTEALCTYSSISDSTTGFEVNEIIDFDVNVTDSAGQTDGNQSQQIIPNRKPTVTLDTPENGVIVTSPVDLGWTGSDEDGDSLSYNVTVATDSSLNNVVHTETTSVESAEVSGLSEGDYYWVIEADDSYSTVDSSVRNFTVSAVIENVSITLEGDFNQITADGEQITTGTYTDLSYPYIAMSDSTGLQGLVSYGSFVEAEYSTNNGRDKIRMKQKFSGERMLLVANDGAPEDLEQRREVVESKELLDLPKASFTGRIPDESMITAMLRYTDIDLVGNETISLTGNTEILIQNEGTESGKVQVRIVEG